MTGPLIALVGTLDTKGDEYGYLRECVESAGGRVLLIDAGVRDTPGIEPDITRDEIAEAAGCRLEDLVAAGDRARALEAMGRGAGIVVSGLVDRGECAGALCAGGSGGTAVAVATFRALPFGFPKLIVSTQVASAAGLLAGGSDVMLMSPVSDIAGLNRVTRTVLSNAAAGIVGAARSATPVATGGELVFATMLGLTTAGVTMATRRMQEAGYEVVTFHATGEGGRAMEGMLGPMETSGMLDLTTVEIADEIVGGVKSAGSDRLRGAGRLGLPQVVSTGGTDMVRFGPKDSVPERFSDRTFHSHSDIVTLMRTTSEECYRIGSTIGSRLSESTGPAALLVPVRGSSELAVQGGAFHDAEADDALIQGIRDATAASGVDVVLQDTQINDPRFAAAASDRLLAMLGG